ncbi:MAG: GH92 family glycosyl hydrolase [Bacteroidales bacterium]|nr:GH92 family glycosyl hydrolase [Bacteroidales bacterium]
MRKINLFLSIAAAAILAAGCNCHCCQCCEGEFSPVDYVNPLVGSLSDHSFSTGNTYPALARPWGMNFWTPQNASNGDRWVYTYDKRVIRGFREIHSPSPWIGDYGSFSVMPMRDAAFYHENERASIFSHLTEVSKPYYYSAYLADHDVLAEMTATERAAIMRFTFPDSQTSGIVIDAFEGEGNVFVDALNKRVIGWSTVNHSGVPENFRNYFVIEVDKEIEDVTVEGHLAVLKFKTVRGEKVCLKAASSFISDEQARENLRTEIGTADFDTICEEGRAAWNKVLGAVKVESNDTDALRTFYSCLYRSTLFPRKFYEINRDGKPVHYSPYNGKIEDGYMYTDSGFWDTFRALFPLLNLVYPSVNEEIQQALANISRENEFLPEWSSPGHRNCMVGNNSASLVADAYLKGNTDKKDVEDLYRAILHGTENVHPSVASCGRLGHEYYNTLGYVPCDVNIRENAARTLEYAYDDWCILQMAKKMGRPESELATFAQRAGNYANLFDASSNLMRGRNQDGSFQTPFNPYAWGGNFTEGNAWHYTWSVFHDVQGLIDLMGGEKEFATMLDSVMVVPPIYDASYYGFRIHEIAEMQVANMGNYAHGNQPAQHMLYLYNYCGQPWKAQKYIRNTMNVLYRATPDGYCGDEDNGQTSAWYIFSALGFYPVCPASDQYVLGSPAFDKIVVKPMGKHRGKIVIKADGAGKAPYIESMKLDGKDWSHNWVSYSDLAKGASLKFTMSCEPNCNRGTAEEDKPYSFSRE